MQDWRLPFTFGILLISLSAFIQLRFAYHFAFLLLRFARCVYFHLYAIGRDLRCNGLFVSVLTP